MAQHLHDDDDMQEFERELETLLNRHNIDGMTGTPDYILARHLIRELRAWDRTLYDTRSWHGWPTLGESLHQRTSGKVTP